MSEECMAYYKGKRDQDKTNKSNTIRAWAKKLKAIELLGGACEECGESRVWLLDFHHVGDEKKAEMNALRLNRWAAIESEIKNCKLLCRNCHGDIHYKNGFLIYEDEIRQKSQDIDLIGNQKVNWENVIELHKQGLTQLKIAKQLHCGISTVCEILKSSGIHTFEKRRKLDPLEIIQLRQQGLNNVQIAAQLGCARYSIPKAIRRYHESTNANADLEIDTGQ